MAKNAIKSWLSDAGSSGSGASDGSGGSGASDGSGGSGTSDGSIYIDIAFSYSIDQLGPNDPCSASAAAQKKIGEFGAKSDLKFYADFVVPDELLN